MPNESHYVDSIVNTMAFTGYPDSVKALSEMHRVLKPGGKIVLVDVNFPEKWNWQGMQLVKVYVACRAFTARPAVSALALCGGNPLKR